MEQRAELANLIMGFIPAQAVCVVAELGIADLVAKEPKTAEQLAAATNTHPRTLFRLLRFVASLGIFNMDENNRFHLTPKASLLHSDTENSMRSLAQVMGRLGPLTANHLIDAIRAQKCPFEEAFGIPIFGYLAEHPEEARLFDAAMSGIHGGETEAVLQAYDYTGVATLADIGCGNGSVLCATLGRYPALRGVFFDQAHVMERTRGNVHASGVGDRAELESGSFFESVPAGADTFFLRHIIHDWTDEESLRILRNIRRVIPSTGRLLLVETVVPDGNDPAPAKAFDITMMMFPNGVERTEKEYRTLLKAGGFDILKVTPTASPVSVIDARPV